MSTTESARFRLILEYDGTDFAGFQVQGRGERTVQGELERALARLSGEEKIRAHGAGRTDAGVHASGQVVHFDAHWKGSEESLARALNANLPPDVAVKQASRAEPGFHARFDATGRTYRYVVLNRSAPSALLSRFALHEPRALSLSALAAAARELCGTHDFAAFGAPDAPGKSTVRRVDAIRLRRWRGVVFITVRGNAFLRSQVRNFVSVLLLAGRGRLEAKDVRAIRESRDRARCPAMAPARGLCLVRVDYDGIRIEDTINEDLFGQAE